MDDQAVHHRPIRKILRLQIYKPSTPRSGCISEHLSSLPTADALGNEQYGVKPVIVAGLGAPDFILDGQIMSSASEMGSAFMATECHRKTFAINYDVQYMLLKNPSHAKQVRSPAREAASLLVAATARMSAVRIT
jgi:hypothetical protein